jgi:hypothetical protein
MSAPTDRGIKIKQASVAGGSVGTIIVMGITGWQVVALFTVLAVFAWAMWATYLWCSRPAKRTTGPKRRSKPLRVPRA